MAATLVSSSFFINGFRTSSAGIGNGNSNCNGGRREFEGKPTCLTAPCRVHCLHCHSPFLITCSSSNLGVSSKSFFFSVFINSPLNSKSQRPKHGFHVLACLPPSPSPSPSSSPNNTTNSALNPSTKLFVSGLSFRTTEEGLRNAFLSFGQLVEVKLVMDKIANRSRGFAFLRYAAEDESKKAIEGMHGKFLDGRVIFVEVAKPRSEPCQGSQQHSKPYQ